DSTCSYDDHETAAKEAFVRRVARGRRRSLVWDLGCNEGRYSRIASNDADLVVAGDSGRVGGEDLYAALKGEGERWLGPLAVDLADPSRAIGWDNMERQTLLDRARPELALCLALVHHLSISRNVPLREVVRWLHELGGEVVVEFPHRDDPMVRRLLGSKRADA